MLTRSTPSEILEGITRKKEKIMSKDLLIEKARFSNNGTASIVCDKHSTRVTTRVDADKDTAILTKTVEHASHGKMSAGFSQEIR